MHNNRRALHTIYFTCFSLLSHESHTPGLVVMVIVVVVVALVVVYCYAGGFLGAPFHTPAQNFASVLTPYCIDISSGFFVGKEGPMIHSGAIIGAGVPQFRSMLFKWGRTN